eukprot:15332392-Ditylum_brightwellii.AAC.1
MRKTFAEGVPFPPPTTASAFTIVSNQQMQLHPKSLDQASASLLPLTQPFLQRQTRKRIQHGQRLAISLLMTLPLLGDVITSVDEIVQEECQHLILCNLVSDSDDDSDNDDIKEEEEQAVDFVGRSKRHYLNSCVLMSSDTLQDATLSFYNTFLHIQSLLQQQQ